MLNFVNILVVEFFFRVFVGRLRCCRSLDAHPIWIIILCESDSDSFDL